MTIKIVKDVVWTKMWDEVAILNSATGTYFGLDPVGSRIWCLIADGRAEDEVVSTILAEYEIDEQRVRADLRELVDQLAGKALVTLSNDDKLPR
jgi:hypothetical protein